jgi:putative ABC transport system substrate-binding protein
VHLLITKASSPAEIEAAFAILAQQRLGALLVSGDTFFFGQRVQLATLAAHYALPAIYPAREFVDAGGLVSYGPVLSDAWRLAGAYAGRILKGEKPADLSVQQSTHLEMVLNLKVAKALGLTVPLTLRARADEVIE